jgi:transketolase
VVVAVGPMLDRTLAATQGLDVAVLYAATVRPFDRVGLRAAAAALDTPSIVLVEPYLAGTSLPEVSRAFEDRAHRAMGLGVAREETRSYGEAAQHDRLHGLDTPGIRRSVEAFAR